jgi:hypothetical protein
LSWRTRDDLGLELVADVHAQLKIADHWTIDQGRGFGWWASDYCQCVWADDGLFHNAAAYYRVHAEIELLHGAGHADECELPLTQAMTEANLSALVFDREKDTFKLHCSMYASRENVDWLKRVFLAAAGLQVTEAHMNARALAQALNATPATSSHPHHGLRDEPDPMVEAEERFFRPYGGQPSRWTKSIEWGDARERVKRLAYSSAETDNQSYLKAEFEWCASQNGEPMLLEIRADRPHPRLGNGLSLSLRLPTELAPGSRAHTALQLNDMERRQWNWCHDVGSWCCAGDDLAFNCFVPNVSFAPMILSELAHDMAIRAKWANEQFYEGTIQLAGAGAAE